MLVYQVGTVKSQLLPSRLYPKNFTDFSKPHKVLVAKTRKAKLSVALPTPNTSALDGLLLTSKYLGSKIDYLKTIC